MVLDLFVHKTDDGYTAEVPSINGCESWAHDEDKAIDNVLDLAVYYLKLNSKKDFKLDKARSGRTKTVYKIVFDKAG